MTWADFNRRLEAWLHNENQDWDRIRYVGTMLINTAFGNKKTIQPKDLFKLPHDNISAKIELPSQDELDKFFKTNVDLSKKK